MYGIVRFWKPKKKAKIKLLDSFLKTDSQLSRWLPVFLWASVMFMFSATPSLHASDLFVKDYIIKKSAHITEYAILYTLIYRATKKNFILAFVLTVLFSASDEFHQRFVIGRTSSVLDLGFDLTGDNIAAYILWKLSHIHRKKQKS